MYQEHLVCSAHSGYSGYAAEDGSNHRPMKTMEDAAVGREHFAHSGPAKQEYLFWGERAGVAVVPVALAGLAALMVFGVLAQYPR
jgi:hypothetical protein